MAVLFTALEKSSENIHSKQQEFMVQSKEDIIKKLKQQHSENKLKSLRYTGIDIFSCYFSRNVSVPEKFL